MSLIETIVWRRRDQPGHESARLTHDDSRWHITGTAVFAYEQQPCRLDYEIDCDAEWLTSAAKITGWIGDELVTTEISVDGGRHWQLNGEECKEIEGCLDLDLNFSPVTNLLPIRRLNLEVGDEAEVRAAWLRFPSLTFEPLDQMYRRLSLTTYRYESDGGRFVADLKVNDAGFVTLYPKFWQAEGEV